jgi:hypothetical protein
MAPFHMLRMVSRYPFFLCSWVTVRVPYPRLGPSRHPAAVIIK